MTIHKEAWNSLEVSFPKCFRPNIQEPHTPEYLIELKEFHLYCEDALQRIRCISSRTTPRYTGDKSFTKNGYHLLLKIFQPVFSVLRKKDIKVYVMCLDQMGNPRPEKAHTSNKRRKDREAAGRRGERLTVELPVGRVRYFTIKDPLPGTMNQVFSTSAARADLYAFITEYVRSEHFARTIPEGKKFILSGGAELDISMEKGYRNLAPIHVTRDECIISESQATTKISEGDLDVWRWVHEYPSLNAIISSGDGDVLLAGMTQMRHIIRTTPGRSIWFLTRRSAGSIPRSDTYIKYHTECYKLYKETIEKTGDPVKAFAASRGIRSAKPRGIIRWANRYVDVRALWLTIQAQSTQINSVLRKDVLRNPAEMYVLLLCLASGDHDYIDRTNFVFRVGSKPVFMAFVKHIEELGDLVSVFRSRSSPRKHYYQVHAPTLYKWARFSYIEAALMRSKIRKKETERKYLERVEISANTSMSKNGGLNMGKILVCASQCAWVLQYYGNGVFPEVGAIDATAVSLDINGLPMYAYTRAGFAGTVSPGDKRTCPPLVSS